MAGRLIAVRGGRTGGKIHLAFEGMSGSMCGIWFKHDVRNFVVPDTTKITCEKCIAGNPGLLDDNGRLKRR